MGVTKQIPLTRGLVALVDDDDFVKFGHFKWYADVNTRGEFTAARAVGRRGAQKKIKLHNVILPPGPNEEVDHKDHDRLNDTKANLRICTRTQNVCNRRLLRGKHSFKGVRRNADGRWEARIAVNNTRVNIGTFPTELAAALAYDDAARKLHGEFACLNIEIVR
jgi:hypothetical protein